MLLHTLFRAQKPFRGMYSRLFFWVDFLKMLDMEYFLKQHGDSSRILSCGLSLLSQPFGCYYFALPLCYMNGATSF